MRSSSRRAASARTDSRRSELTQLPCRPRAQHRGFGFGPQVGGLESDYHHDGFRSDHLDPDSPIGQAMLAEHAERSPDGADHFKVVLDKGLSVIAREPTLAVDNLRTIAAPTLVLVGDDDLVELSHTTTLYESLPAGELAVVPRASHLVHLDAPADVARLVLELLRPTSHPAR